MCLGEVDYQDLKYFILRSLVVNFRFAIILEVMQLVQLVIFLQEAYSIQASQASLHL